MKTSNYKELKAFFKELTKRYTEDQISAMATKLTFYIVLSSFPLTIVILEILRITKVTNTDLFFDLTEFVPDPVMNFIQFIFSDVTVNNSSTILPFAILIALWSSSRGINALIQSLNRAYRVKEKRNFIVIRLMAFVYTIAFLLVLIITGALIIFGNRIYQFVIAFVVEPSYLEISVDIIRYAFSILLSIIFFNGLYNVVPIKGNKFMSALPGTIVATVGWIGISALFSIYVNLSTSLSYMYGSLTDIIIVLLWLYTCSIVIIIGGEVNAIFGNMKASKDSKEHE